MSQHRPTQAQCGQVDTSPAAGCVVFVWLVYLTPRLSMAVSPTVRDTNLPGPLQSLTTDASSGLFGSNVQDTHVAASCAQLAVVCVVRLGQGA
jgi:hypothetical protein